MPATTTLHTLSGALTPRAPFDGEKSLRFLRAFTPTEGEQAIGDAALTKALSLNGRAIAFTVRNAGTLNYPALAYDLTSEQAITPVEHAAIRDRISFFLSLDDDLAPFYDLGQRDAQFAPVIQRFVGLHQPKFLTPFEIACWAVLGQRIPMPVAQRIKREIVERWGTQIALPDGVFQAFPEPQQLAEAAPVELLAVVRNPRKVDYLQAVIRFFLEVDEQWLRHGPFDVVAARVKGIHGIGDWSMHFIMVRGLGRMERVMALDGELTKAAAILYNTGQPLAETELRQICDGYGDYQGYWAYYTRIGAMNTMQMVGME